MAENKKYYWLKLKDDFFNQPRIKKLRKLAGGDTYTIIYLKLQLLSLKDGGTLVFEGIEDDFAEELSLIIDEDIENIKFTLMYLLKQGLIEEVKPDEYAMIETMQNIGSESESAKRVRNHRERQKALQCNADVTNGNAPVTKCNTDIDIRYRYKDKDLNKDLDSNKDKDINKNSILNKSLNTNAQSDERIAHEPSPIITIILNDKSEFPIFQKNIDEWKQLYPSVDVDQQLRNMKGWCNANPTKRKTKSGILRFINSWLAREQDKPSYQKINQQNQSSHSSFTLKNGVETSNPFIKMMDEMEEEQS